MQKYSCLIIKEQENIGIITLNRYENRNALTDLMKEELIRAIDLYEKSDEIKSIILTGEKNIFCAGGDIKTLLQKTPSEASQSIEKGQSIISKILACEKPIIAMLNGIASGAGCSIVLSSDAVIATHQAKLVFSFSNVGLIPDLGGIDLLPKAIGIQKSKELFFLGKELTASEAFTKGIFNYLVNESKLMEESIKFAVELNSRSQSAIQSTKKVINEHWYRDLTQLFESERKVQVDLLQTDEVQEYIKKFIKK